MPNKKFLISAFFCLPLSFIFPSWWFQPLWNIIISQTGSFPRVGLKIKNIWNHHPVYVSQIFMEILGTLDHHETSEFAQSAKVQRTDLCWDPQTASSATLKTTRRSKPALVSGGRPPKIKPGSVFLGKVLAIKKGSWFGKLYINHPWN